MKSLLVLIVCVFSTQVLASNKLDRTKINKTLDEIHSIPLKYRSQDGIWFPKKDADTILILIDDRLKLSLDIIDKQQIQIDALKSAVDGYKQSINSYIEIINLNQKMIDVTMKHIPNLDPPEPIWYENTKATFVYGLIVGGIVVIGTTYLATRVLDRG